MCYVHTMRDIRDFHQLLQRARQLASITQQDLAARVGTSQSAIAKLEQGDANPTIDTLARCAAAAGFALRIELVPQPIGDSVVERYKQDVDRTLLRENLRKSVDERLRTLAEWQHAGRELEDATKRAKARAKPNVATRRV